MIVIDLNHVCVVSVLDIDHKLNLKSPCYLGKNRCFMYLSEYGVINFGGTVPQNRAVSCGIFSKTRLTISPKYIPEINFTKN